MTAFQLLLFSFLLSLVVLSLSALSVHSLSDCPSMWNYGNCLARSEYPSWTSSYSFISDSSPCYTKSGLYDGSPVSTPASGGGPDIPTGLFGLLRETFRPAS